MTKVFLQLKDIWFQIRQITKTVKNQPLTTSLY